MPTQRVGPECHELLQEVASSLLKARKVVVMTGAGISTNSGIPDFRSENGLYSLIQAQFDAAAHQDQQQPPLQPYRDTDDDDDGTEDERGPKRRCVSADGSIVVMNETKDEEAKNTISVDASEHDDDDVNPETLRVGLPTTPRTSPPAHLVLPPSAFRSCTQRRFLDLDIPASSSPLSSPPPVLFDPYESSSTPSESSPSRRSSTSQSDVDVGADVDDSFNTQPSANQGGKTTLPNMKGKDLFDASIWADPLRTSVFYTFATSLRKKIQDCEPTGSHRFISHLRDRGKLVRCYTQNIDQIEEKVGLSTSLEDGPGSRGRFSRRSTTNASQLSKMVEEAEDKQEGTQDQNEVVKKGGEEPKTEERSHDVSGSAEDEPSTEKPQSQQQQQQQQPKAPPKLERSRSGVECVFLHGSLESLRCFLCGRISSWDDTLESETLSGQQPECPHCIGATTARQERGKRALGVGKLRPDIVLYGEEHPNAHLISPIVTHDISICPDMLLILGTSLRVHGLKVLVREFAKAIHSRDGKVVFVNFTKPSESSWGDVIDYWVQWDCDAWVSDLQTRVPKLWMDDETAPPKKKKKTEEEKERERQEKERERRERPPPVNPAAMRDNKQSAAYWSLKIRDELFRITGTPSLQLRASEVPPKAPSGSRAKRRETLESRDTSPEPSVPMLPASIETSVTAIKTATIALKREVVQMVETKVRQQQRQQIAPSPPPVGGTIMAMDKPSVMAQRATKPKPRRSSKSGVGAIDRPNSNINKAPSSTLNPHHGRARKPQPLTPAVEKTVQGHGQISAPVQSGMASMGSILNSSIVDSVKGNARTRKRKKIDGVEVVLPGSKMRRPDPAKPEDQQQQQQQQHQEEPFSMTLAPMNAVSTPTPRQVSGIPPPMEPISPPAGPVSRITASISNVWQFGQQATTEFFKNHWSSSDGSPWLWTQYHHTRQQQAQVLAQQQQQQQRRDNSVATRQQHRLGYGDLETDAAVTLAQMGVQR
ncbi:Sir2 family [Geosmithia morbida]|uniref:Sir2 family n=1 Tax=Geosmithia morbida TaxID=1094350 RepID=A0A9P4YYM7_9HYPO|nr:Sir2 family [Geosmithia morbida]KAF4125496.1 Sir2 family [Geosmithia morbida]